LALWLRIVCAHLLAINLMAKVGKTGEREEERRRGEREMMGGEGRGWGKRERWRKGRGWRQGRGWEERERMARERMGRKKQEKESIPPNSKGGRED
jgi:hypothetical protein